LVDSLNRDRERQLELERLLEDANNAGRIEAAAPTRARVAPGETPKPTASEQLERAEAALKDMQSTLTGQHPDIVTMKQTIAELRTRAEAESARQAEAVSVEAGATDQPDRSRPGELRAE